MAFCRLPDSSGPKVKVNSPLPPPPPPPPPVQPATPSKDVPARPTPVTFRKSRRLILRLARAGAKADVGAGFSLFVLLTMALPLLLSLRGRPVPSHTKYVLHPAQPHSLHLHGVAGCSVAYLHRIGDKTRSHLKIVRYVRCSCACAHENDRTCRRAMAAS